MSKTMQILDPSVYGVDYSKAEFKTFCHATNDDAALYDYDGFKILCDEKLGWQVFSDVLQAIQDKKELRYVGFTDPVTGAYFEVQWD
jgi:hypothetical protein